MNKTIQLIGITPEQFQNAILEGVRTQLNELKKDFQPKEPTELLTRQETADLFKVDLSTLHNWNKKKILTPCNVGARVYYRRKDIEQTIVKFNS